MHEMLNHFPDINVVFLECEKQNEKACKFYLKQGFKIIKEKEENIEGTVIKTVEMKKNIAN